VKYHRGTKVIAISDVSGGIIREEGLDIDEISEFIANKKLLMDYEAEGVKHISNEELLECDCDVLIPAALENQITRKESKEFSHKINNDKIK
jgi:glutamate dehydrogenase (NAD(P)+)